MGKVVLCKDLLAFTDAFIVPYLIDRKDFALLVQHKKVPGLDLNEVCEHHMDALVAAVNDSPTAMVDDVSYEPTVDTIDLLADFQVQQASEVSDHLLLIRFKFAAFLSFTYFIPRSDYHSLPEEQITSVAVLDENWNEYVMRVGSSTILTFVCRLTFNSKVKKNELFEVESVERAI